MSKIVELINVFALLSLLAVGEAPRFCRKWNTSRWRDVIG